VNSASKAVVLQDIPGAELILPMAACKTLSSLKRRPIPSAVSYSDHAGISLEKAGEP